MFAMKLSTKLSTVRVLSRRGSLAMIKYLNGQHFICSSPYFFLGYLSCCDIKIDLPATYKNGINLKKNAGMYKSFSQLTERVKLSLFLVL